MVVLQIRVLVVIKMLSRSCVNQWGTCVVVFNAVLAGEAPDCNKNGLEQTIVLDTVAHILQVFFKVVPGDLFGTHSVKVLHQ